MKGQRRVVFEKTFDLAVEPFGGYQHLDPILEPVVDSLYANPLGFPLAEDDWFSACRYVVTKPWCDLPSFVIIFTIDEDETVSIRDIFENEDY
jgi:hypothetical protein